MNTINTKSPFISPTNSKPARFRQRSDGSLFEPTQAVNTSTGKGGEQVNFLIASGIMCASPALTDHRDNTKYSPLYHWRQSHPELLNQLFFHQLKPVSKLDYFFLRVTFINSGTMGHS